MKVAINAHLLSDRQSYRGAGVSNYSAELLRALGALAQEAPPHDLEFVAYLHAQAFDAPGVRRVHSTLPLEHPTARILWEQSWLPVALRRADADLVHGLVNVMPLAAPCPAVITVHDLAFVRTPATLPPLKRAYLTRLCRASAARAAQIIAVSQQTADDLQRFFGASADRITVVHNGVAPRFMPHTRTAQQAFRQRRRLPDRYLLYLGTLEPRKNLERLVRAYARWRATETPEAQETKLVLAGAKGWYYTEIFRTVEALELTAHVLFPGFIAADELPEWYAAAAAFVYPSLFEGFGLPVLEAMACQTPVICSRAPGVAEVAGDAALLVAPTDEDGLVAALQLLLSQPDLQRALVSRGQRQAARFTWRRCAEETVAAYRRAVRGAARFSL